MSRERELLQCVIGYFQDQIVEEYPLRLIKEIEAELAKPEPEPVAWASPNVIPLRGLKDNHPAILTPFQCEANTVPLYTSTLRRGPLSVERVTELWNIEAKNPENEGWTHRIIPAFARAIEKEYGIGG